MATLPVRVFLLSSLLLFEVSGTRLELTENERQHRTLILDISRSVFWTFAVANISLLPNRQCQHPRPALTQRVDQLHGRNALRQSAVVGGEHMTYVHGFEYADVRSDEWIILSTVEVNKTSFEQEWADQLADGVFGFGKGPAEDANQLLQSVRQQSKLLGAANSAEAKFHRSMCCSTKRLLTAIQTAD
ncbi:hypothetical protein M3Y99_01690000 [Aphelenchoides fujianensis]|nr:hypothetical protein M3Y99_01690000 [Aphelenchoides fujianensis]